MPNSSHNIIITKLAVHLMSLSLIANIYYQAIYDQLGADPVERVLHFTGIGTLNLLLLGLLISPAVKFFKVGWLMQCRRLVGLYAFFYATCHLLSFWAFEIQFDPTLFVSEIIERPYITVGMVAFFILTLLAATSFHYVKRRMGRMWQHLHNWVYLAVLLGAIHYYWSVKSDVSQPLIYFAVAFGLLYFRRQKLLRFISKN